MPESKEKPSKFRAGLGPDGDGTKALKGLERIAKRVIVVGRFSPSTSSGPRTDRFEIVRLNGGGTYKTFVERVLPRLVENPEKTSEDESGRTLDYYVLQAPPSDEKIVRDAQVAIQLWHPFFQLADYSAPAQTFTDPEGGRAIFEKLKEGLAAFARFQSRHDELLKAFKQILQDKPYWEGEKSPIPDTFNSMVPLPNGFVELFFRFLYDPDRDAAFDLNDKNLQLDNAWKGVAENKQKKARFELIMTTIRDFLIVDLQDEELKNTSADRLKVTNAGKGKIDLRNRLDEKLSHLKSEYRAARQGLQTVSDILQSKVLLFQIKWWMLNGFNQLKSVKDLSPEDIASYKHHKVISESILAGPNGPDLLAKPIIRASPKRRNDIREHLLNNVTPFVNAILGSPTDGSTLDGILADAVAKLRQDASFVDKLKALAARGKEGLCSHIATEIQDYILPTLFPAIVTSEEDVKQRYGQLAYSAWLSANQSAEAIRRLKDVPQDVIHKANTEEADAAEVEKDVLVHTLISTVSEVPLEQASDTTESTIRALVPELVTSGAVAVLGGHDPVTDPILVIPRQEVPGNGSTSASPQFRQVAEDILSRWDPKAASQTVLEQPNILVTDQGTGKAEDGAQEASQAVVEQPNILITDRGIGKAEESAQQEIANILSRLMASSGEDREALKISFSNELSRVDEERAKIFAKYGDRNVPENSQFRRVVEAMVLASEILRFSEQLGLGRSCSYLYGLLLDMVQHVDLSAKDKDGEDPRLTFFRAKTLTRYVDSSDFSLSNGQGFTRLDTICKDSVTRSAENIKQFLAELHGIKLLLENAPVGTDVLLFNGSAKDFLESVRTDNLAIDNDSPAINFRTHDLIEEDGSRTRLAALVYFTSLSFSVQDEVNFTQDLLLESLKEWPIYDTESGRRVLLPPFCLTSSESLASEQQKWLRNFGTQLDQLATPGFLLGSGLPARNKMGLDLLIPAGYVVAAQLLALVGSKGDAGAKSVVGTELLTARAVSLQSDFPTLRSFAINWRELGASLGEFLGGLFSDDWFGYMILLLQSYCLSSPTLKKVSVERLLVGDKSSTFPDPKLDGSLDDMSRKVLAPFCEHKTPFPFRVDSGSGDLQRGDRTEEKWLPSLLSSRWYKSAKERLKLD